MASEKEQELSDKLFVIISKNMRPPKEKDKIGSARGQLGILHYLMDHESEEITPSDLSKNLHVGSGRIGNALKNLELNDEIKRVQSKLDKRKSIISLTDKGRNRAIIMREKHINGIKYVISKIGYENFERFISLLEDVFKYINEYEEVER